MKSLLSNKIVCWFALLLVVVYMGVSISWKAQVGWWAFCDGFFIFMSIFSHICSLYLKKMNPYASRKLDLFAFAAFVLFIISFIIEWIIFECCF